VRLTELVQTQRPRSLRLAWRLLGGDAAAAEDVVQEAFVRAYHGISRFREDGALEVWYQRILLNEVRRYQRWRMVRERWNAIWQSARQTSVQVEADRGLQERIAGAMAKLSRGQRETFVLIYLEGFSIRQVAALLGRAPGTIKSHLHRALRTMRAELQDLQER
jgi:RNA polymerase sigma-70 factor (ECF subfamily)